MPLKQTSQEYTANIATLEQSILPAVLSGTAANGQMISGWLLKNVQDKNGLVDASVANLRKAVSALNTGGFIEWVVAPGKQVRNDARGEHANSSDVVADAVKKFDGENDRKLLTACEDIIKSYRGRVHSITYKRREQLQAEFDKLLAAKTKPAQIKAALESMAGNFPD